MSHCHRLIVLLLLAILTQGVVGEQLPEPIHEFDEALVIGRVREGGRQPIRSDAVEHQIVQGIFSAPAEGDTITSPQGVSQIWNSIAAQPDGWINSSDLRSGYAFCRYDAPEEGVLLLDARGHSMVYVNGVPRVGDPYRYGSTVLPVKVRKGMNDFLFLCGRGGVKASLRPLPRDRFGAELETFFVERDDTLPHIVRDQPGNLKVAVLMANAAGETRSIGLQARRGELVYELGSFELPARSLTKIPLELPDQLMFATDAEESVEVQLEAGSDTRTLALDVRNADQKHRVTFESGIDGSVQYYAVVPPEEPMEQPGLILSLHGASVEAQRQASCYRPTDFAVLVAPTNRRPFGFDWEDWGRWDALEVMEDAKTRYGTDPLRQWLTGHSMGGHGTWHLGAMFPDRFAAIAPSAGWPSFETYTGARVDGLVDRDEVKDVLLRSAVGSDTVRFKSNYAPMGVFILHGDADDNVPVEQARMMRGELGEFHPDFVYQEIPGAGHWWGDQCMDWPPLIEFLEARSLPESGERNRIDFTTPGPGISPSFDWVTVVQQERPMEPSRVRIERDLDAGTVTGTTENVRILKIDLSAFTVSDQESVVVELDGSSLQASGDITTKNGAVPLKHADDGTWSWDVTGNQITSHEAGKNPERSGPFKDAFRNRMRFVVGTAGTPEENELLREKARFDAEQWWYRGNGSVEVLTDEQFLAKHDWRDGRNIILYGNADTNGAWDSVVDDEIHVDRGGVRLGDHEILGENLAVLMVRPVPGDSNASVGIVTGTGMIGNRLVRTQPYWVSGIGYPDFIVLGSEMLEGSGDGVRATGFFGNDWTLESGELVLQGEAGRP